MQWQVKRLFMLQKTLMLKLVWPVLCWQNLTVIHVVVQHYLLYTVQENQSSWQVQVKSLMLLRISILNVWQQEFSVWVILFLWLNALKRFLTKKKLWNSKKKWRKKSSVLMTFWICKNRWKCLAQWIKS